MRKFTEEEVLNINASKSTIAASSMRTKLGELGPSKLRGEEITLLEEVEYLE